MKALAVVLYLLGVYGMCKVLEFCGRTPSPSLRDDAAYYRRVIEAAGLRYVGIQEGLSYSLVLFDAPSGSTLAVKASEFTLSKVQERLAEHEEEWKR